MHNNLMELRNRVIALITMYRALLHTQLPDGAWDWFLLREINELEQTIAAIKTKIVVRVDDNAARDPREWIHAVFIIPQDTNFSSPDEHQINYEESIK